MTKIRVKKRTIWDTMPKPDQKILALINATDDDLDNEYNKQKVYEDRVIEELGPEKGEEKIIEEGMDLLVERLNTYQKYFEEVENWKEKVRSEYIIVKKEKENHQKK